VRRLRRDHAIQTRRRRRYVQARATYQRVPAAPNHLTWPFHSPRPNAVWVADITFVPTLSRIFSIRSTEGFVETFGPALLARIAIEAPNVRLWFVPKLDKDSTALRDGVVDLETGITSKAMGPEIRTQGLFRDRLVGIVRKGHPLARGKMTAERYAAGAHVHISRRGLEMAPVDHALERLGLSRCCAVTVGGFGPAIVLAGESDMIATVPERHTRSLWRGMHHFPLPMEVPTFIISLFWHPRLDADPAHQWLRSLVTTVCRGDS
jgi:DNA-binding transcriptional LysR family regulator